MFENVLFELYFLGTWGFIGILIAALLASAMVEPTTTSRTRRQDLIVSILCPFPFISRFAVTEKQEERQRAYILAVTFFWPGLFLVHLWRLCAYLKRTVSSAAP